MKRRTTEYAAQTRDQCPTVADLVHEEWISCAPAVETLHSRLLVACQLEGNAGTSLLGHYTYEPLEGWSALLAEWSQPQILLTDAALHLPRLESVVLPLLRSRARAADARSKASSRIQGIARERMESFRRELPERDPSFDSKFRWMEKDVFERSYVHSRIASGLTFFDAYVTWAHDASHPERHLRELRGELSVERLTTAVHPTQGEAFQADLEELVSFLEAAMTVVNAPDAPSSLPRAFDAMI